MTPSTVMPAPGAVCPAIVINGWRIRTSPRITPLTSNTTIRGPSAAQASARLPGPKPFRFVTLMTLPPLPPRLTAPQPSAPGNALGAGASSARPDVIENKIAQADVQMWRGNMFDALSLQVFGKEIERFWTEVCLLRLQVKRVRRAFDDDELVRDSLV